MGTYQRITKKFEAWHYSIEDATAQELFDMIISSGGNCCINWELNELPWLTFTDQNGNNVDLRLNSWLVKDEDGHFFSCSNNIFNRSFVQIEEDYSTAFKPQFGINRCRFYDQNHDKTYLSHDEVMVEADEPDDFDPTWLGPTPNPYHYGYCRRCGQPFVWNMPNHDDGLDPTMMGWVDHSDPEKPFGWVETTKEAITAEYQKWVTDAKKRAVKTVREIEEARDQKDPSPFWWEALG